MSADAANVEVAVSGTLSVAATGTTAPTNSTTALAVGFTDVGWISQEGVTESYSDDTADIIGNDGTVLRRLITGSHASLKFIMLESNSTTVELYHKGSTIAGSGPYSIDVKAPQADIRSFAFDVLDGSTHVRIYVATGEVTERGDIVYSNGAAIGYEVTVSCYPDANKVLLTKFTDSAAWA